MHDALSFVRGPGTILEEIGNEAVQGRGRFPDALPRLRDMQDARLTGLLIGSASSSQRTTIRSVCRS